MAILLSDIETEQTPNHKLDVLPVLSAPTTQRTHMKIRSNWKPPATLHETATGEPPAAIPFTNWVYEPRVEQQGPVMITRPAGRKILIREPEELDPTTLFNTQFNSRRSTTSSSCSPPTANLTERQKKRRVSFARKVDIIPPACTDLVLYREYGPDSFRPNTEAQGASTPLWGALLALSLVVMEHLSLI